MKLLKELLKKKINRNIKERCIILDTSALESNKIMQVIERASKVILLCTTIEEMDKYKKAQNTFGSNIREISRRSREDKKSEKYICVAGYERHKYNDKNIIDYCKDHRETIIVTSDNNLCNFAKAYKIEYIFLERKKDSAKLQKPQNAQNPKKSKKTKKKEKIIRQQVKGVKYNNGKLYFSPNNEEKYGFLFRNGKIVEGNEIELEIGDIIYRLKEGGEEVKLTEYEIQVISEYNYAFCKRNELIQSCKSNSVREEKIPKEVSTRISNLLSPVNLPQNEEVYFYKNFINVCRYKGYQTKVKLERKNKLINLQDYQEGDYLYILRYNKKNKYVEITVMEIALENNIYKAYEREEKQRVYYINEIYKLDFSEELKEAIKSLLISNTKY
jgi:rRNA-processing protein FCF1